jgi:hypothetical protein
VVIAGDARHSLAHLVREGTDPRRITRATFSRRTASALNSRVQLCSPAVVRPTLRPAEGSTFQGYPG